MRCWRLLGQVVGLWVTTCLAVVDALAGAGRTRRSESHENRRVPPGGGERRRPPQPMAVPTGDAAEAYLRARSRPRRH